MHETKKQNNNNNTIVLHNYETIEVIFKVMFSRQNYNICSTNLVTLSKLFLTALFFATNVPMSPSIGDAPHLKRVRSLPLLITYCLPQIYFSRTVSTSFTIPPQDILSQMPCIRGIRRCPIRELAIETPTFPSYGKHGRPVPR